MLALISGLLGFFSSFLPEILHFLKDKKDKEHELKLIDMQIKALKTGHSARLEEIQIKADNDESKYLYQYASMQTTNNSNYSQEGALISFVFNCGAGAFQASSLRQKLLRGEYLSAADEFPKWVYARGVKLKGLVRRRLVEREIFLQN
ncbi:lysozyme [Candidatus Tisiphia endosymbiont of Xenochironomus xenolabis]|jgi:GH24 family phage-related lysozyme (muramidase)|uniref:lysozyme n=1 Tax=unclassified Candidatus Tisiphia TaxID=2996318 RepID=UPI0035C90C0A